MLEIHYHIEGWDANERHEAWLYKGNNKRLVCVLMPNYNWKRSFAKTAKERGFIVIWR